ncbi:uncharacterized protein LOC117328156 [Pecten maximus]|uniref:uncharacterized protein LOC117328156 n=1 Tax=Pecten maximus TaxID=6579 RepID=UPI0014590600|nr:uncharacterized protein LOC117328156 [Pecten maximus]
MASKYLVFLLLLVQVVGTLAVPDNEDSIEMRFRKMERDFSLSIKTLKSELKDTQDKLRYAQAEIEWTKSTVKAVNLELLATRTDLKETRIGLQQTQTELQKTRAELFATKSEFVKTHSMTEKNSAEDGKDIPGYESHRISEHGKQHTASNSPERLSLAPEPQSTWRRIAKQPNSLATRGRRVSDVNMKKAFSAQTSHHENSLVTHQTVLFPHVILNEGSAYDNLTGVFTCPEAGIYHFSVTIMVFRNDEIETELVVNGNQVMFNYAGGNQRHNQGTNAVLLHLDIGDRVWVRILENPVVNPDGAMRIHGYGWSTFTGFMI